MKAPLVSSQKGAVLVFALLCSAVSVVGLTYWIMTVTARGQYVDELYEGTKRRMARQNGRVIATRYVHRRVLPSASGVNLSRGIGSYFPDSDNYEWGGIDLTETWSGSPLSSVTDSIGVNRISYGDARGFGLRKSDTTGFDLPISLLDGSQRWSFRWQARSYSPALAGDLLVVYRPPSGAPEISVSGNIAVHGRVYAFMGPNSAGPIIDGTVTFDSYASSGMALASRPDDVISNYPPIVNSAWALQGAAPVEGYSNVVWDPVTPGYSLRNKALDVVPVPSLYVVNGGVNSTSSNGYSSNGEGAVTIDLSNQTIERVVVENAATLEFKGQATATAWSDVATYPSVLVVYHQAVGSTYDLATITFTQKNNRRVVFGVKKDEEKPPATLSFPDVSTSSAGVGPQWRLIAHFESTPVSLDFTGSTLNVTGGLATDRNFAGPTGSGRILHIYREPAPLGLTSQTPRRAWAEGFKMDE